MRVNLNPSTSILQAKQDNPIWLEKLQNDWLSSFDVRSDVSASYRLLWTLEGAKLFHSWLENEGFKVKLWDFPIMYNDTNVAFGIEFIDSCPKFVELKLST